MPTDRLDRLTTDPFVWRRSRGIVRVPSRSLGEIPFSQHPTTRAISGATKPYVPFCLVLLSTSLAVGAVLCKVYYILCYVTFTVFLPHASCVGITFAPKILHLLERALLEVTLATIFQKMRWSGLAFSSSNISASGVCDVLN
jgi:hypothetical protein